MWPFNFGEDFANYPRKWSDMSFEFKGMFAYHLSMMALFALPIFGLTLRIPDCLFAAAAIALSVALLSWFRRRRAHWHWRGIGWREPISLLIMTVLFGFFIFVGGMITIPPPPGLMPWILAGLGIYVFSALLLLHITHLAEAQFRAECGEGSSAAIDQPREARWKRIVRGVFSIYFLAVWLTFMAFAYIDTRAFRDGALAPTGEQAWELNEHGVKHYITKLEHDRIELLKSLSFIGIPSAIALTFVMQYLLGIQMGWRSKRDS